MTIGDLLKVRVHAISFETETVRVFEFRDLDGNELPAFDAGSHIDVHVSETVCRSYSLINESDGRRYRIAVARDDAGRGGSKLMHSQVAVGQSISISRPRNNFPLVEGGAPSILIAGGIGVTPLLAMLNRL